MWDKTFRQTMQSWFLGIRSPPSVSNLDAIDVTAEHFVAWGPSPLPNMVTPLPETFQGAVISGSSLEWLA